MNRILSIPVLLLFLAFPIKAISQDVSVIHYQGSDFDAVIFPENSSDFFPGKGRFTPTKNDVYTAEKALKTKLKELNADKMNQSDTPVIDKNLKRYKRQYFGYLDEKGNKILFINCFWKNEKEESELWMKERIRVLDGGSFYWNIKFNMEKNELFDLDVNGNG
jgi:hypothetical protein